MHAITFHGKQKVRYETVADPAIEQPHDVILKVELTAICGSDLHPYHEREKGLDHGTVMGHEFVGEIVEVGKNVGRLRKGMRVFSPFTTNCGRCFYCRRGLTCRCESGQLFGWVQNGRGLQGGQAEYVRVPLAESSLLELPESVSNEEALLLGDILATGYYCADMAGISQARDGVYVVLGCGPVGLFAVIAARDLGAEKLFAIDAVPERLQMAERFGATAINYLHNDATEIVKAATDGRGADAVMEVVGSAAAGRAAVDLLRPGGIISTVGVHTEQQMPFSPVEAYDKNLTYKIGRCPARHYMERLVPIVQEKRYDVTSVITHRIKLSEGVQGYRTFDSKADGCMKVVMQP